MSVRKKLEDSIAKKQAEIDKLKEEIASAESYIQGIEFSLKHLPKEEGDDSDTRKFSNFRHGSDVQKAKEAIKQAGKALYIDDLLEKLGKEVNTNSRASLAGSIGAYVRDNDTFTRPKPNTFGLIKFDNNLNKEGSSAQTQEPYNNFEQSDDEDFPF